MDPNKMASCSKNRTPDDFVNRGAKIESIKVEIEDAFDANNSTDSEDSDTIWNDSQWLLETSASRETLLDEIKDDLPGQRSLTEMYSDNADPLPIWKCLFTDDMTKRVLTHTNERMRIATNKYTEIRKTSLNDIDDFELNAFLGLVYYSAILKLHHEDIDSLFSTDGTGREIFRCTMSLKRLLNIFSCLAFEPSEEEVSLDKDASITWLFDKLVSNSQKSYCVGKYVCIDKMSINYGSGTKNVSPFKRNTGRGGVKMLVLCDVHTEYLFNGYIYTGKSCHGYGLTPEEQQCNDKTRAVLRLVKPLVNSNHNVTANKEWFGSLEVVNELAKRKLTYVGPLSRRRLGEIPADFIDSKGRSQKSLLYHFTDNATLLSFVTEKKNTMILISSKHRKKEIKENTDKPHIVTFYDSTRGAVARLEQSCTAYSTYNRRAARFSTAIFYAVLDVAAANAFILYSSYENNPKTSKFHFIKGLAKELVEPHLKRRVVSLTIPREIRTSITRIIGEPIMRVPIPKDENGRFLKRRRCQICPSSRDKKTNTQCLGCFKPMCGSCRAMFCKECGLEFQ